MNLWDHWKKGFFGWEEATAKLMEQVLRNPLVLQPSGSMLTAAMKAKAATDDALAKWWALTGLPTRRDQERLLHAVDQLNGRLMDLEDKLDAPRPQA